MVDVATAAATAVIVVRTEAQKERRIEASTGDPTEVPTAVLSSASLVPSSPRPLERWSPAELSPQVRLPDISP